LIPPKKEDIDPLPATIDEADFEETDLLEVRSRSFPASADFFDRSFASQFGEGNEADWQTEDDDGSEPECRPQ
jgi:DnaJ homolog subfamily A member 2